MNQEQHIAEEIQIQEDSMKQEFNINLMESENQSIEFDQSKIRFKKHNFEVNRFGAIGDHEAQATVEINPDLIKEQRKIGKGSAGEVWLATYSLNNQEIDVAIKQIPAEQKESRDQFVQDLKCFLNSDCPNIVKFYGCFYEQGYLSQVIEYMNLGSLRDLIKLNKLENSIPIEPVLAELSRCILTGLQYIHKKHQIHRDIKPQNILINNKGEVKITDFGITKQLQKTIGLSGTWVGTHMYMSPQRLQIKLYGSNCDVWSFGLVLYELATCKQLPYRKLNGSLQSAYVFTQAALKTPPPAFQPNDNRSAELSHFLNRCLEIDPNKRANVEELLSHPWITKNKNQKLLKQYIKLVEQLRQKHPQFSK